MNLLHSAPRPAQLWLLLLVLLASLLAGCQNSQAAAQPTATPTWPPLPAATATIVPPTSLPEPVAESTTTAPAPTPTLIVTPTPEAGYYGNPALGFGFFYPSEWPAEPNESGLVVRNETLQVWAGGFSELLGEDETIDDYLTALYESILEDPAAVEVLSETTGRLWDGAEAQVIEFTEAGAPYKARATLVTRDRRVYLMLIVAPLTTFETYPETLEAIAASMKIEEPRPYGISRQNALFLAGGQPRTLDPAQTHGSVGGDIGAIFSGLVMFDRNLQVVPDLAESWEVDDTGAVYTFHLRPQATFHDGKPVTAHDVKFSWERAADPATESETAITYLGDIVGVKEKLAGEVDEISGLEVVDDHTLRVTIDAPKVYFLAKLTYPTAFIVDEANVKQSDWEKQPNGTGPFRLQTWEDDRLLILARNDNFYLEPARLEHIVTVMYADVGIRMYENDEIDLAGVGSNDYERATDPDNPLSEELHEIPALCTSRLILDLSRPPFDDPLVRQAFAYAVDREKLSEVILKGRAQPARSILPPGMPGYSPNITAPAFDPDRAKELLAQSKYAGDLPEIIYTTSGLGGELSDYEESLLEMWRDQLGVEVTVEQLEPENFLAEVRRQHGHIIDSGWCADYPDPENFLDVLYHSESEYQNLGGYHNPEVDKLLEQARTETDVEQRLALYNQVEQMIIDDTPDILLHQSQGGLVLIKPYLKNYPLTPIFPATGWREMAIEREGK